MTLARVVGLFRYPVKGLSPEPLPATELKAEEGLPGDRRYAIALPSTQFDPTAPVHLDKTRFLMLMRDERLAALTTHFDAASQTLTVARRAGLGIRGCLEVPEARAHLECFFAHFMAQPEDEAEDAPPPERPHIVDAEGHMFSDSRHKYVSIVNIGSLRDFCAKAGLQIEPLRFRANLYVDGWEPWAELDLVGKEIAAGETRLAVSAPIERCGATNVNPMTALRDMNIPKELMNHYGRNVMGVYARVIAGGALKLGDAVEQT
jgi:MOSC domain-containing protein